MSAKDYDPPSLIVEHDASREVLYEIGVLTATAAQIDWDVGVQIVRLISPADEIAFHAGAIVVGMDFKVKLALIRSLAAQYGLENSREISVACDKLQDAYQKRNSVAHHPLIGMRGTKALFQNYKVDAKTGSTPPPTVVSAREIRRWSLNMEYWAIQLNELIHETGAPKASARRDGQALQQE